MLKKLDSAVSVWFLLENFQKNGLHVLPKGCWGTSLFFFSTLILFE